MSVFKAKPVVVPDDTAERFDEGMGKEKGFLREMIADKGNLGTLEEELLAIGLMSMVKGMMEDKELGDDCKALSVERLSNIVYMIVFSYCTGIMRVRENGDVDIGHTLEDSRTGLNAMLSKTFVFANGKRVPTDDFRNMLKLISSESSIGESYNRVVKRQGLTRGVPPEAAFSIAKTSIIAAKAFLK